MRFLYSIGIQFYALGVRIAALWNPKARLMVDGWQRTFGRLSVAPVGKGLTAWFHASSLGEFEQARPVLEAFRRQHPDYKICVTFFSPSGYEVRKNYAEADFICYLPMDTPANARRFVNLLCPTVAFFAKYDYWFNYLEQLYRRDVPTYIFSALFRPNQYFFRWYGTWFRNSIGRCFTHLFVQNEESMRLLQAHGIPQVSVAGDTRFDRVQSIAQAAPHNEVVEAFLSSTPNGHVLLAGSSWEPDEAHLHQYLLHAPDNLLFILAPHVVSPAHLNHIETLFGKENCVRYSTLLSNGASLPSPTPHVLIIDNVGMLSSLYRYADVAYIGGGFGKGIHNLLEAIVFGKPVVFGPAYHKFREACDIIRLGGGFSYSQYPDLEQHLDNLFSHPEHYAQASSVCLQYVAANLGSTDSILEEIRIKN